MTTSKPLLSNSCRHGGCTLTGALSATTHVRDAATIIHGPKGCAHHNFSLFHATGADNDRIVIPDLVSTGLEGIDIVFGGEPVLARTIRSVAGRDVRAVFVLSTCVIETIGDDVAAVCGQDYGVPVIPIPTAGFLGGTFQEGLNNALIAIAGSCGISPAPVAAEVCANIIGEKNLEYEAEENYAEVERLLLLLGIPVNSRFIRTCCMADISRIGAARVNILREPDLVPAGTFLQRRFGTPFQASFPTGFSGTIRFLESVGRICAVDSSKAIAAEELRQADTLADFEDIAGGRIALDPKASSGSLQLAGELAERLDMSVGTNGRKVPLPFSPPVGSAGVRRLLHRWRCAIHA
ncbi:MAG TPA: nitrogenase component 1 [Methanoregula sp.]|nr:nitrogenase component 1 [Methanoregula sp.]